MISNLDLIELMKKPKTPDDKDRLDGIPGLFAKMDSMQGAIEAVRMLAH